MAAGPSSADQNLDPAFALEKELQTLKIDINSILLTALKEGRTEEEIFRDYKDLFSKNIQYNKFGFETLTDLLMSMPGDVTPRYYFNELRFFPVVKEDTMHIAKLVGKQKSKTGRVTNFGGIVPDTSRQGGGVRGTARNFSGRGGVRGRGSISRGGTHSVVRPLLSLDIQSSHIIADAPAAAGPSSQFVARPLTNQREQQLSIEDVRNRIRNIVLAHTDGLTIAQLNEAYQKAHRANICAQDYKLSIYGLLQTVPGIITRADGNGTWMVSSAENDIDDTLIDEAANLGMCCDVTQRAQLNRFAPLQAQVTTLPRNSASSQIGHAPAAMAANVGSGCIPSAAAVSSAWPQSLLGTQCLPDPNVSSPISMMSMGRGRGRAMASNLNGFNDAMPGVEIDNARSNFSDCRSLLSKSATVDPISVSKQSGFLAAALQESTSMAPNSSSIQLQTSSLASLFGPPKSTVQPSTVSKPIVPVSAVASACKVPVHQTGASAQDGFGPLSDSEDDLSDTENGGRWNSFTLPKLKPPYDTLDLTETRRKIYNLLTKWPDGLPVAKFAEEFTKTYGHSLNPRRECGTTLKGFLKLLPEIEYKVPANDQNLMQVRAKSLEALGVKKPLPQKQVKPPPPNQHTKPPVLSTWKSATNTDTGLLSDKMETPQSELSGAIGSCEQPDIDKVKARLTELLMDSTEYTPTFLYILYGKRFKTPLDPSFYGFVDFNAMLKSMPDVVHMETNGSAYVVKLASGSAIVDPAPLTSVVHNDHVVSRPSAAGRPLVNKDLLQHVVHSKQSVNDVVAHQRSEDAPNQLLEIFRCEVKEMLTAYPQGLTYIQFEPAFEAKYGRRIPWSMFNNCMNVLDLIEDVLHDVVFTEERGKTMVIFERDAYETARASHVDPVRVDVVNLRNLLLRVYPKGLPINSVAGRFEKEYGRRICSPLADASRLQEELLQYVPDEFVLNYITDELFVVPVCDKHPQTSASNAHVAAVVAPQRKTQIAPGWLVEKCPATADAVLLAGAVAAAGFPLDAVPPNVLLQFERFPVDLSIQTEDMQARSVSVFVREVVDPWNIFVQQSENGDRLMQMMADMKHFYMHASSQDYLVTAPNLLRIGMMLAAEFEGGGDWHRVLVLDVSAGPKIQVYYVDYGTTADDLRLENVRFLARRFLELPAQAIFCRLSHVKPPVSSGDLWSEKATQLVIDKTEGVDLWASVNQQFPSGKYSIGLCDTRTDEDVHITDLLLDHKHLFELMHPEEEVAHARVQQYLETAPEATSWRPAQLSLQGTSNPSGTQVNQLTQLTNVPVAVPNAIGGDLDADEWDTLENELMGGSEGDEMEAEFRRLELERGSECGAPSLRPTPDIGHRPMESAETDAPDPAVVDELMAAYRSVPRRIEADTVRMAYIALCQERVQLLRKLPTCTRGLVPQLQHVEALITNMRTQMMECGIPVPPIGADALLSS